MTSSTPYDAYYFATGCGRPYERHPDWLALFDGIAARIVRDIEPGSVLDAGCAFGFLVEALRQRGVDAYGIDVSDYAIGRVDPSVGPYCRVGSITEPQDKRYDLVVCIEVLEHLTPQDAELALDHLCQCTDDVLFSSTPHDYAEVTHVNVRPPAYWAEAFARRGFVRDLDFEASFITAWAARYQRSDAPLPRVVAAYERRMWELSCELAARRRLDLENRETIARLTSVPDQNGPADPRIAALEDQLHVEHQYRAQLAASPGGRLLASLQRARARVAPPGSARDRIIDRLTGRSPRQSGP